MFHNRGVARRVRSNVDVAGGRHFIPAVTPRKAGSKRGVPREGRSQRGAFPERGSKPGKALCKGGVWPCPPSIPAPSQPRNRGRAGLAPFTSAGCLPGYLRVVKTHEALARRC